MFTSSLLKGSRAVALGASKSLDFLWTFEDDGAGYQVRTDDLSLED